MMLDQINGRDVTISNHDATEQTKLQKASDKLFELLMTHHPEQAPANIEARRRATHDRS